MAHVLSFLRRRSRRFIPARLGLVLPAACLAASLRAEVKLPSIISDHMILQRSAATAIWGKAAAAEKVRVALGDIRAETTGGADGAWRLTLDLGAAKEGPHELIVEGANRIVVSDVLVGEVWLCSGQSNIAYTLNRSTGAEADIAASADYGIRQFRVDTRGAEEPLENCKGSWVVADPKTTPNFSAVGYYFAKDMRAALKAPVGIVLSAWAGTVATAWTSRETLAADPELDAILQRGLQAERDYPAEKARFVAAFAKWQETHGRQDQAFDESKFAGAAIAETEWKTVELPAKARDLGLPDSGAIWFRKTVPLPRAPRGQVTVDIGGPHDFTAVYWNGRKLGGMTPADAGGDVDTKRYSIPAELCREGDNVLAIRLFTPTEKAGFNWQPFFDVGPTRTLLAKGWLAKTEFELSALTPEARKERPRIPSAPDARNVGARLYNGMIAPLVPVSLAGVLWYQGEQDAGRSTATYRKMLQSLIRDWRGKWGAELPFVLCQLPNYGAKTDSPDKSRWAEIRQAQLETLALPRIAQAVLIDVGDENVHPGDKRPVGQRAALAALGGVYGKTRDYSGPVFKAVKRDGARLVVSFDFADQGLVAKPLPAEYQPTFLSPEKKPLARNSPQSELEGFALCGPDGKWLWADARIEGRTVVVSSPRITSPVAVRYAWADNPTCNLYGAASGLPASPFEAQVAQ